MLQRSRYFSSPPGAPFSYLKGPFDLTNGLSEPPSPPYAPALYERTNLPPTTARLYERTDLPPSSVSIRGRIRLPPSSVSIHERISLPPSSARVYERAALPPHSVRLVERPQLPPNSATWFLVGIDEFKPPSTYNSYPVIQEQPPSSSLWATYLHDEYCLRCVLRSSVGPDSNRYWERLRTGPGVRVDTQDDHLLVTALCPLAPEFTPWRPTQPQNSPPPSNPPPSNDIPPRITISTPPPPQARNSPSTSSPRLHQM